MSQYFGFFIQFSFQGLQSSVIEITTETNVIPETYPFPDCNKIKSFLLLIVFFNNSKCSYFKVLVVDVEENSFEVVFKFSII